MHQLFSHYRLPSKQENEAHMVSYFFLDCETAMFSPQKQYQGAGLRAIGQTIGLERGCEQVFLIHAKLRVSSLPKFFLADRIFCVYYMYVCLLLIPCSNAPK